MVVRSSQPIASATAAAWAASTCAAIAGSANAHSAEMLFTGEKVRSYPATDTRDPDVTNGAPKCEKPG